MVGYLNISVIGVNAYWPVAAPVALERRRLRWPMEIAGDIDKSWSIDSQRSLRTFNIQAPEAPLQSLLLSFCRPP